MYIIMITNYVLQVDIIIALKMAKCITKKEPRVTVLAPYKAQKELVEYLVKKLNIAVVTLNESQGYKNTICAGA